MAKKRLSINTFIERANIVHNDKYDYSKVSFDKVKDKIEIICPIHGNFIQEVNSHLMGNGCPKCGIEKSHNPKMVDEFIASSIKIHGDKYGYSKVKYVNNRTKVCIICHEHGEFLKTPTKHLNGQGCPSCSGKRKIDKSSFIEKSNTIHSGKYDYSKVEYTNKDTKVCIICPEHGEFWQSPEKHLIGQGCPSCRYTKSGKSNSNTIDRFKNDIKTIDKLIEADKTTYVNYKTKMKFMCHKKDNNGDEHGEFWMTPNNIFNKNNPQCCPKCGRERTVMAKTYSTDKFIELASKKHNNKFSYIKTDLKNKDINGKVCITCPKHGDFWQLPNNHLYGQGCPICKESTLERECKTALLDNNIKFIEQYNVSWMGRLSLDFYLPDYNVGIECQGKQHFGLGNWNKDFDIIIERDNRKRKLCKDNSVKLLYYSNLGIDYPYEVFESLDELLTKIKENG